MIMSDILFFIVIPSGSSFFFLKMIVERSLQFSPSVSDTDQIRKQRLYV